MAEALIAGFLDANLTLASAITLSSQRGISAQNLAQKYGLSFASSNEEAIMASSLIFLCVKPAQALEVLRANAPLLKDKLIISIVAGIPSHQLFDASGTHARIIRTMPNLAVGVRQGVTTITPHCSARREDILVTKEFFGALGALYQIEEDQVNIVTALSGSGPAFALLFFQGLLQASIQQGLPASKARSLAAHVLAAASALMLKTEDSATSVITKIASPQGTTEAGLEVLKAKSFSSIVATALVAASRRAEELALSCS